MSPQRNAAKARTDSIAKISSNVPFIMPKAIAETDPFKQIESAVGSGPFIFRKEQWVPGSKVVSEKFKAYVPRMTAAHYDAIGPTGAAKHVPRALAQSPARPAPGGRSEAAVRT